MITLIWFGVFMISSDLALSTFTIGIATHMRRLFWLLRIICRKSRNTKDYTTASLRGSIKTADRVLMCLADSEKWQSVLRNIIDKPWYTLFVLVVLRTVLVQLHVGMLIHTEQSILAEAVAQEYLNSPCTCWCACCTVLSDYQKHCHTIMVA